ncbi:MAG: BMP family ABC transporter substrate-binding protein [Lachnospiraceae bacterium]|nr:BMP family ABC transporter substrate-binding protein [Lachnospiraceae bacterium]
MKKLLSIVLAGLMILSLAACTKESPAVEPVENQENNGGENNVTPDEGQTEAANVKVGFIFLHDDNSTYDLNFINGAKEACDKLGVEYVLKTNIPEGQECYETACDLADSGCNIVFADSFGHEDFLIEAAKEYPNVEFCHATGTKAHTANLPNYHNAFASIYEGRYLAGVAAGMKLNEMIENGDFKADEAKIGYVGAYTYAEVISGYTAFFLGARSECPTATMEVTFTGSWYDETAEKEGAMKLINNGCKLISQHADSMGAPTACETNNIPNVSYNGSTESVAPNTFIVSSRINWAPYFELIINSVANGQAIPTDYTGTMETGSVVLTDLGAKAPAEGTQAKLDQVKKELQDGTRKVFDTDTFTVNGEKVNSYMADVDTDEAYEGDHEVIANGAFNESADGFRSAPYFDLRIDGIKLLDEQY